MTQKQRVIDQIQHKSTDHVPIARLDFEGDVAERLDGHYGGTDWRSLVKEHNHIVSVPGAGRYGTAVDETAVRFKDMFGATWRTDRRPIHLEESPLKEPSLAGYSFPDPEDLFEAGWKDEVLDLIDRNEGKFIVNGLGTGLFARSWIQRGYENALMDSLVEPDFYEELVERTTEFYLKVLDIVLTVPVDGIFFGDDWGYQRGVTLGPERWRRFIKPNMAKLYERAHQAGKFTLHHSCGKVDDIIPDLIEIGLDVLQSVQPEVMDPYELKTKYGDNITFWGGLGSQRIIPFGTPDEIKSEIDHLCRDMSVGGGYILGPAKQLQPETPTENAAAVVEGFMAQVGVAPAELSASPV